MALLPCELDEGLSPTSYSTTGLTYIRCTHVVGGYIKIGKIVIVNIRVTPTDPSNLIVGVNNFPTYTNFSPTKFFVSASCCDSSGHSAVAYLTPDGLLNIIGTTTSDLIAQFVYVCN